MSVVPFSTGLTEIKIAERSKHRTSLVVMNLDAVAIVYVRFRKGVVATNGIPIGPNGSMSLAIPEDDPTMDVWAIADTATTPVIVYEGFGLEGSSGGIQAKDVIPQFKLSTLLNETNPTLNVWYPVLNISGSGMFYQGRAHSSDAVTSMVLSLRVTLDGVVLLTALSPDQVGGVILWIDTITTMKTLTAGPLNFTVPFKNSLLVEVRTDTTLVVGQSFGGQAMYGEN